MKRAIGYVISDWDDSKVNFEDSVYQCWWYTAGSCPAHAVSAGHSSCGCKHGYIGVSGKVSKRIIDASKDSAVAGAAGAAVGSAIPVIGNAVGATVGAGA